MSPKITKPNKLNRIRATRLTAIEGQYPTPELDELFARFDTQNMTSDDKRAAVLAKFEAAVV